MEESDGYFYIVQLLPEDAPSILKLGYTKSLASRMKAYKTVCATARILKSWQCPGRYEQPAIAYITGDGSCGAIGRETYRVRSIEDALARGEAFFNLSTEEKDAKARRNNKAEGGRRTVEQMARDAELWERGEYKHRSRDDRVRMRKYMALKRK